MVEQIHRAPSKPRPSTSDLPWPLKSSSWWWWRTCSIPYRWVGACDYPPDPLPGPRYNSPRRCDRPLPRACPCHPCAATSPRARPSDL